ncbi:glycosyltransferase [Sphingobacterium sp. DN00404]|uniref:Glycosyltransferase n=1 Tax=Sphingobacterium micropteri TaxID=2763501 RepID=A0ABR7YKH9_9SPHI|nr:glycosyltransferase [Sphingobacterium micropteri]MBD1431819.1 glycosyltransferase [Sphingobacterium micropteri]
MDNRIAFITGVNSRKAGGLFFTITSIVNKLAQYREYKIAVFGFYDEFSKNDVRAFSKSVDLVEYNIENNVLKKIGFSLNLREKLVNYSPDIIHQQGIWMYYSNEVLRLKRKKNVKVIIQPHGMLDGWAVQNSSFKKKAVGFLYEYSNLKHADCIHALNYEEYKAIRSFGLKQPIAIIPNGIDIKPELSSLSKTTTKKSTNDKKKLLYLGRIHPKKGIELIVDALMIVISERCSEIENWVIQIAGWDQDDHQQYLIDKVKKNFLGEYFEFVGPVFDEEKEKVFLQADAFILPSYSEGLPMTVLEAWSYKLPVLMTKYCNLQDGFTSNAAVELELDVHNIAFKLIKLFKMSDSDRHQIGTNGFKLVTEKYTWDKVAIQTKELYKWICGEITEIPSFVNID